MKAWGLGAFLLVSSLVAAPPAEATPCRSSATTLCLSGGRFSVTAAWRKSDGSTGSGSAVVLTGDTGYFWFFDSSNIEVAIKVLNACGVNGNFWVFASGLTNVGVTLHVTDTATGQTRTYTNAVGTAFVAIQDTSAFETCSTPTMSLANVSGSWTAFLTVNGVGNIASLTLDQDGSEVNGTVSIFDGGGGSLTGTISSERLNFSAIELSPCPGTFTGSATVNSNNFEMTGSVSGADCGGSFSRDLEAVKVFSGGPPATGSPDMSGGWTATLSFAGRQDTADVTITQNGAGLSGTAAVLNFGNGSFVGSIVNQQLIITLNELSPCLGILVAVANNASSTHASGTFAGDDCGGQYQGTFSMSKR